ncbi:MAG: bifunctional isocitrate dehydrogenase kinase/phosphatase, partial [Planctomycetales bacterium]|nr:bifunctional isocitrate dehydrogenase kinase/phosphatase [Planctomycetales bacterium]
AEPWFAVDKYDVFPQEFRYFLGLPEPLRREFLDHHADLLTVGYWLDVQRRLRGGELFHLPPYAEHKRLVEADSFDRSGVNICELDYRLGV